MCGGTEHLKALCFELIMDVFTLFVLLVAYKYTYDTLQIGTDDQRMNFLKNAFVFLAPGSLEGFRIFTSLARKNIRWDIVEVALSAISIVIAVILLLQCLLECDMLVKCYIYLIAIYPVRVVVNLGFEFVELCQERRSKA